MERANTSTHAARQHSALAAERAPRAAGGLEAVQDLRPMATAQRQLAAAAEHGPRAVAQRQQLGAAFGPVVQRLSEDEFVSATTTSIFWCIKWRVGNDGDLARMQDALRAYDNLPKARLVQRVAALDNIMEVARSIRTTEDKFRNALWSITADAQKLGSELRETPEFKQHDETVKAEAAEKQRAVDLGLPWEQATEEQRNLRLRQFAGLGAAHLRGINGAMKPAEALAQLYANFAARKDFAYNFSGAPFFSGTGDCSVLTGEFRQLATLALGIETEKGSNDGKPVYVANGAIVHTEAVGGNIDGAHWLFSTGHVWVLWKGQPIDVLFAPTVGFGALQPGVEAAQTADDPITFEAGAVKIYKKHISWGAAGNFDRYTLDIAKARPKAG